MAHAAYPDTASRRRFGDATAALLRRWPLVTLCTGLAVVEVVGLEVTGFRSALPLAPQASAPASFAVYHDLRWVFTFHWSWASLAWQVFLLMVVRASITAVTVVLAWPVDTARPSMASLLRRNLVLTLLAVVVLSPWAAVAFAAQAVAYSWFMIFSIVASFFTVLVLPLAVVGPWWRRTVLWRSAGWVVLAWLAATVEALAISVSPGWVAVLTAFGGGLLNAVIWLGLVRTFVHAGEPEHTRPLAPVAILVVLAVFLVGGGYAVGAGNQGERPQTGQRPVPGGRPILYVSGFDSSYDGGPFALFSSNRLDSWHYSYQGLSPEGPLPYGPQWTQQAVEVSAAKLADQVGWLHARTGQPVAVIADSEGTLVARAYFARQDHPPVDYYIMTSPLPRPARIYYPAAGQLGWGLAAGWEARLLVRMLNLENENFTARADMPFTRSVVENAGLFRPSMLCPVGGGVRTFAFLPLSGATVVYHGPVSHVPWTALPAWHATLLRRSTVSGDVERLLTTGQLTFHNKSTAAFRAIYGAAAAWQVPALPLSFRTGWHPESNTDPAFADWHCPSP